MAPKRKRNEAEPDSSTSDIEEVTPATTTATEGTKADERRKEKFNKRFKASERTKEEILEAQMAAWKSDAYKHFKTPKIVELDGEVKYRFVCKKNPSAQPLIRARWDDSTSNLMRHVAKCEGKATPNASQPTINEYAHGSSYTKHKMRLKLVLWVTRRHRPYAIVEDPELLDIFRMLYAKVEVPSKTTVSRDVREIFLVSQKNVSKLLQSHPGRLHLCIDGWTSPNIISFLGITVHRVQGGKMDSFILDFVKLSKGHTGEYLAERLKECLDLYGISKKILGITADNASNNATLVQELDTSLGGANGVDTRVRCLAHILNLVVKAIISVFTRKQKAKAGADDDLDNLEGSDIDDEDDEDSLDALETEGIEIDVDMENDLAEDIDDADEYDANVDANAADEVEIDTIVADLKAAYALHKEDRLLACFAVTKLVELAKRIFHSPSIRADLKSCCFKAKVDDLQLVRAIATRWNSLVQAIIRALKIRGAIDKLLALPKYAPKGKKGLGRFKILEEEWTILEQLRDLLAVFLQATERVSQSNVPLLHETIPVIDVLTAHLTNAVIDKDGRGIAKSIRVAAARGLAVLDKYYSATDESIMYRIAMIFHPKYKLDYFRRLNWKPEWIATAEELVREQWVAHYKPKPAEGDAAASSSSSSQDIFASLDNWGVNSTVDAMDEWLSTPALPAVTNPLPWWSSQLDGGNEPLARMALDFLSVPAASTDVERAFSRGGLTVSKRRHSLNDESTRAATVLSSWAAKPGLVPEEELLELFAGKSKRAKKTEAADVVIDSDEEK